MFGQLPADGRYERRRRFAPFLFEVGPNRVHGLLGDEMNVSARLEDHQEARRENAAG
jgi:hypothetical protein